MSSRTEAVSAVSSRCASSTARTAPKSSVRAARASVTSGAAAVSVPRTLARPSVCASRDASIAPALTRTSPCAPAACSSSARRRPLSCSLPVAASEPGAIFRSALAVRHRSAAPLAPTVIASAATCASAASPESDTIRCPAYTTTTLPSVIAERHPVRVADERVDDRTERGPVRGERIAAAAAAARLDRDLERRLPEVDRHRTDVAGEQGQQRDADRQRADPAFENTGNADGGVAGFDGGLREEAQLERLVVHLPAGDCRDPLFDGAPDAVAVDEEREGCDRDDEERRDGGDADRQSAQPAGLARGHYRR